MPLWMLLAAFGFYLLSNFGNAWRWQMVLRLGEIRLPYWTAAKIVFLGAFASNFLPSTVGGDAVRYLSLLRFTEKKGVGAVSLLVDRMLKAISMLILSPISAVLFAPLLGDLLSGKPLAVGAGWLPIRLRAWVAKGWNILVVWFQNPRAFALAFGVGWLSVFPAFLGMLLVARGLKIPVNLWDVIGATVITYFLTLLPFFINGYGVLEVLITVLYTYLGATVEQATALALITRLMMLAATLPGALWLPEILAFSRQAEQP
jgi:uncharacterized membrane protein YbhN (UPF0104 family)